MTEKTNKDVIKMQLALSRIEYYKEVISKTIIAIQRYKVLDVLSHNDYNLGISNLENNIQLLHNLENMLQVDNVLTDGHINILQEINDNISVVCKNYGTDSLEDILSICFGSTFLADWVKTIDMDKFSILKRYYHPIGYKLINCSKSRQVKPIEKNKIVDESKMEEFADNLECFDLARTNKKFCIRLLGMKVVIFHKEKNTMLILNGIVDDVLLSCISNEYIKSKKSKLYNLIQNDVDNIHYEEYVKTIILKEWLIYSDSEIYHKFKGYDSQLKLLKQK